MNSERYQTDDAAAMKRELPPAKRKRWTGPHPQAGYKVEFRKTGDVYEVGTAGNFIRPGRTRMSKKERLRHRRANSKP